MRQLLFRAQKIIDPELDHGKVIARVPMMNEMQFTFPAKPREAFKRCIDQVIVFVQEHVQAKGHEHAEQVRGHYHWPGQKPGGSANNNDRDAVAIQRM